MRYPSKIGEVLEYISQEITNIEIFDDTSIFYDFIEVDENNLPPSCIVYKPLEWQYDVSQCHYERQLDIVLLITDEDRREGIIGQLNMFSEKLDETMRDIAITAPFYLQPLQGSPIKAFAYNRKSDDSYKDTNQLFSSMAVLSYLLRY